MTGINGIYSGLIKGAANAVSHGASERGQAVELVQNLTFLEIPCNLFYDTVITVKFKIPVRVFYDKAVQIFPVQFHDHFIDLQAGGFI